MRTVRLGDLVLSMKNGLYKPASEYADDGTPCLRMYNIEAGSIVWRDIKRMRVSAAELEEYGLREGDLLVNRVNSRELVGKTALIPPSLEASVFESKNIRVRLDASKALPKFINYQLLAGGRDHFSGNAQQVVGMASISQKQLADFPIALAELDEQRRIVGEIEKQFSRLDEAVDCLKRVKANLKRHEAAVLQAAVDGQLLSNVPDAGPPSEWTWGTCGDVIESIQAGASFKCLERPPVDGEIGVVKVSAVTWGKFDEQESKTCLDPERVRESLFIRPGDFLFSRANTIELVGTCVIAKAVTKSLMLSDKILRFRLASKVEPMWLLICLRSKFGRTAIERLATGNQESMRNIGQDRIRQIRLPLPAVAEQRRIVAEVDRRLSIVREVEAEVDANLKRAQALRQAVLARAFGAREVAG